MKQLHTQFRNKRNGVYKKYTAIVRGYVSSYEGEVDLPLIKDIANPPLCKVDAENGKKSLTLYTVLDKRKNVTHLTIQPITGR